MKKYFALLIVCVLFISVRGFSQTFKAGIAVKVITPHPLLPVSGGVGPPNPVTQQKGDLYARALVLEKGDTKVAIVSVDNLGWPAVLGNQSRKLIKGIPPENILISATHTHSAPDAYGFPDDSSGHSSVNLKYLNWCVHQIAEAIKEAEKKLQPAWLKIGYGIAKGKISYNYYAPQLYDPHCGVIQAIAATGKNKGKPFATLVNYAIHPEVIGSERGILSPDLCGPLYQEIKAKGGGTAIFINGAQGGMVTADNRQPNGKDVRTWKECNRIGRLLADQALKIVANAPVQKNPNLYCASKKITFPIESKLMQFIFYHSPVYQSAKNYTGFQNKAISTRLNLLNIGTAQAVTIPGEALPNIGYYIKRHMKTKQPFLFGLTNDAFGYILDKVDFNSFKRYDYISKVSLGEMTGDILINSILAWLKNAPAPD